MSSRLIQISLESLADGIPVMPDEAVGFYKSNCMICFHHNNHSSGVKMEVEYNNGTDVQFRWEGDVTEKLLLQYGDLVRATDNAACAIALLLVRELTDFTGIEQSSTGTTIDYYLAPKNQDDTLIFNKASRLEVSGILTENENNTVEARVKSKLRRLKPDGDLSAIIIVVEFSKPWSKIEMVQP